ncbi:hypothetical protein HMPREF1544_10145 [Mucor circinelloides 1006PhL]|uniref:Uncharacterized protein n=1 Tax=Mucor circinelloides f. circinelloides (strain 1006PhL) TaxID=1220926 RepID=S2J4Q6_MUCC1|nr:hypothetical protein HMPREF1544_10145 [Mucor circinelloides 1006PhL]
MSKRNKRERISYKQADDFVSDFDSGVENDDDSDDQVEYKPRSRPKAKTTKSKKKQPTLPPNPTTTINTDATVHASWDEQRTKELAKKYPDAYWKFHANVPESHMIKTINSQTPLVSIPCTMTDQGPITSMTLSDDGTLLVTYSNTGAVKIYDIQDDFRLVRKLRDTDEKHIDEFYCGTLTPNGLLAVGGKLKDRYRWSADDADNHILPCDIKIFNVCENKLVARLEGHEEEILSIKKVVFMEQNYLISTSQDGSIRKWHMTEDWQTLIASTKMKDDVTCMAFTVSFLPNTGNKYFIAATDEHLRLYDFEQAILIQTFSSMYSSYCDCAKFVDWLDDDTSSSHRQYAWLISRGAEMCDQNEGVSTKPNTCTLHRLIYPTKAEDSFELEQFKTYQHEEYHANSWLVKITSNGRYLLAPTIYGQIFVFNIKSGQVTAIIKEHQDMEVRDVIFHPYRPLIFSCGDDGCVKVYTYKSNVEQADAGEAE